MKTIKRTNSNQTARKTKKKMKSRPTKLTAKNKSLQLAHAHRPNRRAYWQSAHALKKHSNQRHVLDQQNGKTGAHRNRDIYSVRCNWSSKHSDLLDPNQTAVITASQNVCVARSLYVTGTARPTMEERWPACAHRTTRLLTACSLRRLLVPLNTGFPLIYIYNAWHMYISIISFICIRNEIDSNVLGPNGSKHLVHHRINRTFSWPKICKQMMAMHLPLLK